MVAMTESGVKRIQNADLITQFLSGISPEQGIRWISLHGIQKKYSPKRTIPHIISRSLISMVLRAPSESEAKSARDSIAILLHSPHEHDASALGFSKGESNTFIANVLVDMLAAAANDEPLSQIGPSLSFYSVAGAGSGDAEEFHMATPEHRVAQSFSHESLSEIRKLNLGMAIGIYADAFKNKGCRNRLLEVSRSNMHRILTPWLSVLPSTISELDRPLCTSMFSFYSALFSALGEDERSDIVTRLVSSIMQTAQTCPKHLFYFLDGISNNALKVTMCRLCLIQRFRVADDFSKPLLAQTLVDKYLSLKPVKGRANMAVPVLLAVLINSWVGMLPEKKLPVELLGKRAAKNLAEFVNKISFQRRKIIERYTETLRDDQLAFDMAISNIVHHIICAGGSITRPVM